MHGMAKWAAIILALTATAAHAEWTTITTPDGAFRFAAPVPPVAETKTGSAKNYSYTLTTYTAMDGDFAVIALAEHFDSPTIAINAETLTTRLLAKMKLVPSVNESRPYRRGPRDVVPGVFITGQSEVENCQIRATVDGNDAFVLMACSPGTTAFASEKERAIASFTMAKTHNAATWVPVTSGFGALRFTAPVGPEVTKKNNAGVPQTVLFARDGGLLVMATYADAGNSEPVGLEKLTAAYIDGGKYKLIAKTPAPYQLGERSLPGNLIETENATVHCRTRLVVDGTKTYALGACVSTGYEIGDLPDQILATFAITAAN